MPHISLLIIENEIELITQYYECACDIFKNISVASSLKEARRILKNKLIDGIILDNYLPDGLGLPFLWELNQGENIFPTMVITSSNSVDDLKMAIECSVFKYLNKPIGGNELKLQLKNFRNHIEKTKYDIQNRAAKELTPFVMRNLVSNYQLTEREIQILELSLNGESNVELARKLYISHGTVKKHWQNIFDKTRMRSKKSIFELISQNNIQSYKKCRL